MEDWIFLPVSKSQRKTFRVGGWRKLAQNYPMLFDEVDKQNATKQAARGYYFYEWLSAIAIYETTGYRSLVTKYAARSHVAKWRRFTKMVPQDVLELVSPGRSDGSSKFRGQGPDLFVYRPGKADWFFVEAKGPTDKLRESQIKLFTALEDASNTTVKLANVFWL